MNAYLLVKWLHIVSSVVLVGTGFGSAFYLFFANRCASLEARAVVARLVVRADLWFTTPAVIAQPLTGSSVSASGGRLLWTATSAQPRLNVLAAPGSAPASGSVPGICGMALRALLEKNSFSRRWLVLDRAGGKAGAPGDRTGHAGGTDYRFPAI